jgi:hypothetical protein
MPNQYELLQNKAGNDQPAVPPEFDPLAGWPGLSRKQSPPAAGRAPEGTASDPSKVPPANPDKDSAEGTRPKPPVRAEIDPNQIDILRGWPGLDSRTAAPKVSDQASKYKVENGALTLSFKELISLSELPATNIPYSTLRITGAPATARAMHWADESGYYLFFNESKNNYHYPRSLKFVDLNGQMYDVDRSRLKISEVALSQAARADDTQKNPFASITNPRTDAITYFKRMAQLSGQALDWEEKVLRKGVQDTQNPYFHIYLADVLTMQAMQPLVSGFLQGGQISPEQKQAILDKLAEADKQLKAAADKSYGPLYQMNRFPSANVVMPLAPEAFFYTPPAGTYYNPSYSFWGGSWDQAQRRRTAIAFTSGLIQSNVFKYFALPPAEGPLKDLTP